MLVERDNFAFLVGVTFERLPSFCSYCQSIGHSLAKCKKGSVNKDSKDQDLLPHPKGCAAVYVPKLAIALPIQNALFAENPSVHLSASSVSAQLDAGCDDKDSTDQDSGEDQVRDSSNCNPSKDDASNDDSFVAPETQGNDTSLDVPGAVMETPAVDDFVAESFVAEEDTQV